MRRAWMAVAALALGLACGKDPVSYSGPVGISLNARSNDVTGGLLSVSKNVNTETGNPCGAYVHAAEQALGHAPSAIEVASVTLALQPSSTGVTGLEQVFGGTATVSFVLNGSGSVFPVAAVASPSGAGPVAMPLLPPPPILTPADYADIVGCNFKVQLDGPAAAGFATAGNSAQMTATFEFVALD
jgi:hypothetical protein